MTFLKQHNFYKIALYSSIISLMFFTWSFEILKDVIHRNTIVLCLYIVVGAIGVNFISELYKKVCVANKGKEIMSIIFTFFISIGLFSSLMIMRVVFENTTMEFAINKIINMVLISFILAVSGHFFYKMKQK